MNEINPDKLYECVWTEDGYKLRPTCSRCGEKSKDLRMLPTGNGKLPYCPACRVRIEELIAMGGSRITVPEEIP